MSSRVLKKLHGENDLEICEQELSDVDNDIGTGSKKKQFEMNRYDLFQQSLSESEVKEDDNETEHNSTAAPIRSEIKKKRKKRKKKSGKQASSNHRSSEDNADIDEITRTVKEMDNLTDTYPNTQKTSATSANLHIMLLVQHRYLNPSYEMKRMFGSKVIQNDQNKRRNARGVRLFKSTWLVTAKENWPPVNKTGIFMSVEHLAEAQINSRKVKNVQWFVFEHSPSYRSLQLTFLTAVESMDSDNIIRIINQQPYHVDSLIQLSELCKMSEDHAMASELIEHAILALESAFHTMFSLTTGNCRLNYRRQENRCLFIVLFKHAQYLEGRACSRTALEIAKLIMSFDPDTDPLAMILVVDYYALRAKEYDWLVHLYNEWESTNNLSQLPNMAYSYALALFYLHKDGDLKLADDAIQYAVMMFPAVLKGLLDALSIQPDSRVNYHKYVAAQAYENQSPALQQLTSLYVCRSKNVWRDSEILPWLERNVNIVLDKVDARDDIVFEFSSKRTQRYKTPPRAILRHIILADFKEKVPLAPFINKETEPILMYDPLPPLDSINIYKRPVLKQTSRTLSDASPFSMFFQSLLPNFNVQEGGFPADAQGVAANAAVGNEAGPNNQIELHDEDAEGAAGPNIQPFLDLRNSLTSVVDAMRDFLTNIRVPELPNDADVDENESTDDGRNDDYLT